jgi:hypothetical protein
VWRYSILIKVLHSGRVTPDNRAFGKYVGGWVDPVDHLDAVKKEKIPAPEADKTQTLGHPARDLVTALTKRARNYSK